MNKPLIAIDIDDVLAAHAEAFVEFSNQRWNTSLSVSDYDEDWAKMWELDDQSEAESRSLDFHSAGVVGNYKHYEEAKPVLEKLKKNFRLVVVTSRRKQLMQETTAWFDKYFKGTFEEIHYAGIWDEGIKEGSHRATKKELCQVLGASYLIDDQLKHCYAAAEAGLIALLFGDYHWNKTNKLADGICRVKDWQEIEEYFDAKN